MSNDTQGPNIARCCGQVYVGHLTFDSGPKWEISCDGCKRRASSTHSLEHAATIWAALIAPLPAQTGDWRTMETAPKNGKAVDLWGYDSDPTPGRGGILLPLALSLGRYTDCRWHAPKVVTGNRGLLMPMEEAWYQRIEGRDSDERGGWRRIWPGRWMPIPKGPK